MAERTGCPVSPQSMVVCEDNLLKDNLIVTYLDPDSRLIRYNDIRIADSRIRSRTARLTSKGEFNYIDGKFQNCSYRAIQMATT